jgi:hypothetical protein
MKKVHGSRTCTVRQNGKAADDLPAAGQKMPAMSAALAATFMRQPRNPRASLNLNGFEVRQ